jgi:hypothetical protein
MERGTRTRSNRYPKVFQKLSRKKLRQESETPYNLLASSRHVDSLH